MAALTGYAVQPSELFELGPRDVMVLEEAVAAAREGAGGGGEH